MNNSQLKRKAAPIDEKLFKEALSHFATGVTVVTTRTDNRNYGLTVSSFCSVSLEPHLVLACIEKRAEPHDAIASSRVFGVSILSNKQIKVSEQFARSGLSQEQRFDGIEHYSRISGSPLIANALAILDCSVYNIHDAGDHSVFVGEVMFAEVSEDRCNPLLYQRRTYRWF